MVPPCSSAATVKVHEVAIALIGLTEHHRKDRLRVRPEIPLLNTFEEEGWVEDSRSYASSTVRETCRSSSTRTVEGIGHRRQARVERISPRSSPQLRADPYVRVARRVQVDDVQQLPLHVAIDRSANEAEIGEPAVNQRGTASGFPS